MKNYVRLATKWFSVNQVVFGISCILGLPELSPNKQQNIVRLWTITHLPRPCRKAFHLRPAIKSNDNVLAFSLQ